MMVVLTLPGDHTGEICGTRIKGVYVCGDVIAGQRFWCVNYLSYRRRLLDAHAFVVS